MPSRLVVLFGRFLLVLNREGQQNLPHQYLYLLRESWVDIAPGLRAAPKLSSDSDAESSVEKQC